MSDFLTDISKSTIRQAKTVLFNYCTQRTTIIAGYKVIELFSVQSFLRTNGFMHNHKTILKALKARGIIIPTHKGSYYMPKASEKHQFVKAYLQMNMHKQAI